MSHEMSSEASTELLAAGDKPPSIFGFGSSELNRLVHDNLGSISEQRFIAIQQCQSLCAHARHS